MLNTTRCGEDHTRSSVVLLDVLLKIFLLERVDVFLGAEDGAAESLVAVGGGVQVIKDDFLSLLDTPKKKERKTGQQKVFLKKNWLEYLLVNLLHLAKNHVTLSLNRRRVELGVLENIGEDVDSLGHVLLEDLEEKTCSYFFRSKGESQTLA